MAIIRVSGNLGSGKTTLCLRLADFLGYKNYYTGDIFRELAKEKGLSIEEFYKNMSSNPDLEKEIDNRQIKLMMEEDNLVVQGRLAPFQPCNSAVKKLNVFIKVSPEEGARRQLKRRENYGRTFEEMLSLSQERAKEEMHRYQLLYGIENYLDESKFDIVLDTTNLSKEESFKALLRLIEYSLEPY